MSSNHLEKQISIIQKEYYQLLSELLQCMKNGDFMSALDEVCVFWQRKHKIVDLYLRNHFSGYDNYVFTAKTYVGYDEKEHLPFLLLGQKHVVDDSIYKFTEIYRNVQAQALASEMHEIIESIVSDNLALLSNLKDNVLILPFTFLNQASTHKVLYSAGESLFLSLFTELESMEDYFLKCNTIYDIEKYIKPEFKEVIVFSELEDLSQSFSNRFKQAITETPFLTETDSRAFFMIVYGNIQQAVNILLSCIEYNCIPFIRSNMPLHYTLLVSESMRSMYSNVETLRYKMLLANKIYNCCDVEKLAKKPLNQLLEDAQRVDLIDSLIKILNDKGVNEKNFNDNNYYKKNSKRIMETLLSEMY